jgi:hypothetical protein
MLGSPDWVIAWVCGGRRKNRMQYWRDRCLISSIRGMVGEISRFPRPCLGSMRSRHRSLQYCSGFCVDPADPGDDLRPAIRASPGTPTMDLIFDSGVSLEPRASAMSTPSVGESPTAGSGERYALEGRVGRRVKAHPRRSGELPCRGDLRIPFRLRRKGKECKFYQKAFYNSM